MIAYIDSSVILRVLLGQPGALPEWGKLRRGVTSAVAEVECLRTLDRLRITDGIAEMRIAERLEAVYRIMDAMEVVEPSRIVLSRAAQPLPVTLGTLDAVHLATAQLWRDYSGQPLVMATHDVVLAAAARSTGMTVIGC